MQPTHVISDRSEIFIRRHIQSKMTDTQEETMIEALRKVDAHGDVAPRHVQDPMTMVLRKKAIQANLMRWDDSSGRYVLTCTGRSRISTRNYVAGAIVRFKMRNGRGDGATRAKGG
jgi:hypothetical protein